MPESEAGYSDLLRNRRFSYFFGSQAVGEAGYSVYAIVIPFLAYQISGSYFVAGVVLFVEFGIYSLSILAGPFIDRVSNLRSILVVGYPLQALLAATIGLLALRGALGVPLLLALVAALSFLWDFTWTASNAIPPRLLPESDLFRANGMLAAVGGGTQILGYVAGGVLLLVIRPGGSMLLYAGLNIAAALLSLPVSSPRGSAPVGRLWSEFVDGWRYFLTRSGRPFLQLTAFSSAQSLVSLAPVILILELVHRTFAGSTQSYGLLFGAFAVGGIVGALVVGQLNPRRALPQLLVGATIAEGVLIVLALLAAPDLGLSTLVWFLVGAVDVVFYVVFVVYFQATSPRALVGRILTNAYLFRGGARSVGVLVIGLVAGALSVLTLGEIVGLYLVLVGALAPVLLPGIRHLNF